MLKSLSSNIRKYYPLLSGAGLCLFLLLALSGAGCFNAIDRGLYDLLLRVKISRFPRPLNPRIIHIDLNDSAEAALGEELDTRRPFADLLLTLNSVNAKTAFDFVFPSRASADGEFAQAAGGEGIFALVPVEEKYANFAYERLGDRERELLSRQLWHIKEYGEGDIPRARSFVMSTYEISASAGGLGHIGVTTDADGVYRRTPLFYRWEDGVIPALSLALAVRELGVKPGDIEFYPGRALVLPLGGGEALHIPVDRSASLLIPYTNTWEDNRYRISFDRAARAAGDPGLYAELAPEFAGALVMVADTTTGKRDFGITPFQTVYPLSGIHTAVLSAVLDAYFYREWGPAGFAVLPLLVLAAFLLSFAKSDRFFSLAFLFLFTVFSLWTAAAWFLLRLYPCYGGGAAAIFFFWVSGFTIRLFRRYREQILLKNALSRYFPRSLAERIAAEGKTELIPAYKELTMLFSDICSFTRWSADKEPALVHAFLSEYLEGMAALIFEHGGTVDKYMGDGILAFFGDPFETADHTERCIRAAIAMQGKIGELGEQWKERAAINLKVRMGINRGRVIVGNLGTRRRIEYTVIGAAVNLAQRMESAAPPGGILITAAARSKVDGDLRFGERQELRVKGYDAPIGAYEVLF
jgi:adenylate cyclase